MASTSVTPPWLKEEGYSSPPTSSSGYSPVPLASAYVPPQPNGSVPAQAAQPAPPSPLPMKLSTMLFTMKLVTILLCIMMDITAVIGIGKSNLLLSGRLIHLSCLLHMSLKWVLWLQGMWIKSMK